MFIELRHRVGCLLVQTEHDLAGGLDRHASRERCDLPLQLPRPSRHGDQRGGGVAQGDDAASVHDLRARLGLRPLRIGEILDVRVIDRIRQVRRDGPEEADLLVGERRNDTFPLGVEHVQLGLPRPPRHCPDHPLQLVKVDPARIGPLGGAGPVTVLIVGPQGCGSRHCHLGQHLGIVDRGGGAVRGVEDGLGHHADLAAVIACEDVSQLVDQLRGDGGRGHGTPSGR